MRSVVVGLLSAIAALPCLYLGVLGGLACLPPLQRSPRRHPQRRFAVVVPAHNEGARIESLLDSIAVQEYPADLVHVVVVADNCNDDTAARARRPGITVVERSSAYRGKGFALEEGLRHILPGAEAVLFIDGDCTITPNALGILNACLEEGATCIQCRYEMTLQGRCGGTYTDAARRLALTLVHVVRPLGKHYLGASAGLKGSGMCFNRRVIDRLGWSAHGLAEDIEEHIALVQLGERAQYAHDVVVTGIAPAILADAEGQHLRWEGGRLHALSRAIDMFRFAISRRSIPAADTAVELVTPPLSVVGLGLAITTGIAALFGDKFSRGLVALGWTSLALYVGAGVARSSLTLFQIVQLFAGLPVYAAWKLGVYAKALRSKPKRWEPTRRDVP